MASPTIKDTTAAPFSVWSGGGLNPFGNVNITPVVQFAWDGIYGSVGTTTITLTSPDGRTDLGRILDPNKFGYLSQNWDDATNTFTQKSSYGPHPGNQRSPGDLLHGLVYISPALAPGDTVTVQAKISFSELMLDTVNDNPNPNTPVLVTVTDPNPIVMQIGGAAPTSGPIPINVGPDNFTFQISEDAYQGDAQFTIRVDGVQQGGIQTATASHKAGESQTYVVNGRFAPFSHSITIDFLNDAYGGSPTADRNLYVDSVSLNGVKAPEGGISLFVGGEVTKNYNAINLPTTTIGSGPNGYEILISEDAYQGNAQFIVTVDGKQVGGVQTATAIHAANQHNVIDVRGDFPSTMDHTIGVTFLNDAWGGTDTTDRNLYVDYVSGDFTGAITPNKGALFSDGSISFLRPAVGPDKLIVSLSEDAYQGDAQAEITLDGKVLGQVTVTALHPGTPQDFAFTGFFGPGGFNSGSHVLGINFLNDAYGGTPDTDRNLYLGGASLNGVAQPNFTASLFSGGNMNFVLSSGTQTISTIG